MDVEKGVDEGEQSDTRSRRRFLSLLAAGVLGGTVAAGADTLIGDDDRTADSSIPDGETGPTSHDVFVYQRSEEFEAVSSDGDRIHTGSDGWTVLENGIEAVPEGGSILVNGTYESTSTIQIGKPIRMFGHEAYIDHQVTDDFVFHLSGTERRQTTLTQTAEMGANTVELDDASGMQKGDMVLLEEKDGDGVLGLGKPPGESHSVSEIDGSTVRLEDSIVWRDDYPSGTLVYVLDPIEVHLSGFNLEAPKKDDSYYGVKAQGCRDSVITNLWLDKFGSRGIQLEACANSRVRDSTVLRSSDIDAGDGYGIQVWAGCHDILVEGNSAKECRHPLSVTAGGPREVASRSITFRDCFVTSEGSAALNCHGGSAHDVRFEGCEVHTWGDAGVRTGAQKTNVSGCEFRMNGHNAIDTRNEGQEMIITVTDTDIFGASAGVHLDEEQERDLNPLWQLVHLDGVRAYGCDRFFELENGALDRVRSLVMRGCFWDEISGEGLRIQNRIDGGIIEGNDFGDTLGDPHIYVRDNQDTNVNNLRISNNQFSQPNGTDPFIRFSHCRRCSVSDNTFEAGSAVNIFVDGTDSTANMIKQNTCYLPSPSNDPIQEANGSVAADNYVYDTDAGTWL